MTRPAVPVMIVHQMPVLDAVVVSSSVRQDSPGHHRRRHHRFHEYVVGSLRGAGDCHAEDSHHMLFFYHHRAVCHE